MGIKIFIAKDFEQMSCFASKIVINNVQNVLKDKNEYILGLATGGSPVGLYRNLAIFFNKNEFYTEKIKTFNLDEYVGLPGNNTQQRTIHKESYCYFMISNFFGLMNNGFAETFLPYGNLIDKPILEKALDENKNEYELLGSNTGKSIQIKNNATGFLKYVKTEILDSYAAQVESSGGIDMQIIGIGEKGHIAFHESGIPFNNDKVLLIKLDNNTIENSVIDGHFKSTKEAPNYAISMSAKFVFKANNIVLVANGKRKQNAIFNSLLKNIDCKVPLSYAQHFTESNKNIYFIVDETAGKFIIENKNDIQKKGYEYNDIRE